MAKWMTFLLAAVLLAPRTATAQPTADFVDAVVTDGNKCVVPDTKRELRVFACSSGGDRYWIGLDGSVRTKDGYCWDHGVPKGAPYTRNAVHLVKCHGGKSQVWYFTRDTRALVQNAANDEACITTEGESVGARVVVAKCVSFTNPPRSQKFYPGARISAAARQSLTSIVPADALRSFSSVGSLTFSNSARMVAAGGGNIIAAGMVAAGGGNMVAAGGGNMVAAGGGNVLPSGAGRMIQPNGGSLTDAALRGMIRGATPMIGGR